MATGRRITTVKIVLNDQDMARIFHGSGGPVDHVLRDQAELVLNLSNREIGTKYSGQHKGKQLKNSGSVVRNQGGGWRIQYTHPAAAVHYTGAKAHHIGIQGQILYRAGGLGDYSFGPVQGPVRHPGHKGNPYIVKGARQAGFNVTDTPSFQGKLKGFA